MPAIGPPGAQARPMSPAASSEDLPAPESPTTTMGLGESGLRQASTSAS